MHKFMLMTKKDDAEEEVVYIDYGPAAKKFRRICRVVLSILKIYRVAVSSSDLIMRYQIATTEVPEPSQPPTESSRNQVAVFNANKFKSYGKMTELPEKYKAALRTPVKTRSEKDRDCVLEALKLTPQFTNFPDDVLGKMASRVWLEWYGPKRVIVRQGHRGFNYYVIIKGLIEVSIVETDSSSKEINTRVVNVLSKGQSFGEKALIDETARRNATCISVENVELLVVSKDAFRDMFLMMRSAPDTEPHYITFLRKVPFLKDWPLSILATDLEACSYYYYRRGMLICPDINTSQYVYIVKNGSCQVILLLKEVEERLGNEVAYPKVDLHDVMTSRPITRQSITRPSDHESTPRQEPKTPRAEMPRPHTMQGPRASTPMNPSNPRPATAFVKPGSSEAIESIEHAQSRKASRRKKRRPAPPKEPEPEPEISLAQLGRDYAFNKQRAAAASSATPRSKMPLNGTTLERVRNESHAIGAKRREERDSKKTSLFISVDTLCPGDEFALSSTVLCETEIMEQPKLSLVSNGCECIALSKAALLRHSTQLMQKKMQEYVRIYPPKEVLHKRFKNRHCWDKFRKEVVLDAVEKKYDNILARKR